jgi:hypothetical protein
MIDFEPIQIAFELAQIDIKIEQFVDSCSLLLNINLIS